MSDREEKRRDERKEAGKQAMQKAKTGKKCTVAQARRELQSAVSAVEHRKCAGHTGAARWLRENRYLVVREGQAARDLLPRSPRLRSHAETLCRACSALALDGLREEELLVFFEGVQEEAQLPLRELRLLPGLLRLACIERIAAVSLDGEGAEREMRGAIETLRMLSRCSFTRLFLRLSGVDRVFAEDPTGEYLRMDEASRIYYIECTERMALRRGEDAEQLARKLLEEARRSHRHIGFYLEMPKANERMYIALQLVLTLVVTLALSFSVDRPALALLLLLPVSELCRTVTEAILARFVHTRFLPRMDVTDGVPPEGRTLCAVSVLLRDAEEAKAAGAHLEELYWACIRAKDAVQFALLADLPAAAEAERAEDADILSHYRAEIRRLNRKYGGGFYLLTRPRRFDGESYVGHERKRGAILELCRLMGGQENELQVEGDKDALYGIRYLLALDADTRLRPGSAEQLIAAALHPLCRVELNAEQNAVTAGYGILQPHISVSLKSAMATDFAMLFSGGGGTDAYGRRSGELMMNAFGSTRFTGKGLIDAPALLRCTAHFPEGRILSHDAPEGAYLHTAYVAEAELFDAFPKTPMSYYKRLSRWVRGDWQNLGFLADGRLRELDRWFLWENLRHSLVPGMSFLSIFAAFLLPGTPLRLAGWAALLCFLTRLFAELSAYRSRRGRVRRHTRLWSGAAAAIAESFFRLWLLPWEAWVSTRALLTALWRRFVSHRRLLSWETAAQSDRGRTFSWELLFPMLCGLLLLGCESILGKTAALFYLSTPLLLSALALPARKEESLSHAQRDYLLDCARELWGYYTENCTSEDHFLPPDNVQFQPPTGRAHRSSPTNFGLALASAAAACDLGFLAPQKALSWMSRMLGSIEKLPKHRGLLYNWYDTRSLAPLAPALCSSVDCGNYAVSLTVAERFAEEQGDEALRSRLHRAREEMELSLFYDKEKELFSICYDPRGERLCGGYYDLMASEAILLSYYSVSTGQVSVRHWEALSRAQLRQDGYRGLASWTGTMFEYLMPMLFLRYEPGSLLRESCRFCLSAQKKAVEEIPWGISESAYASLDPSMSYRYKAHGASALALAQGMEEDTVIAPYASFLALALSPGEAVENLRLLESYGARSASGFYEAVDFTPSRVSCADGEVVYSQMAHHVGMSLLACANALCDQSIRKRFLSESAMRAAMCLTEERLGESTRTVSRREAIAHERARTRSIERFHRSFDGREDEGFCVLTNGVYSLRVSSRGRAQGRIGELLMDEGDRTLTLFHRRVLPAEECTSVLRARGTKHSLSCGGVELTLESAVGSSMLGELHTLTLRSVEELRVPIELRFTPLLCRESAYRSHPAYWQLGIEEEKSEQGLLLHRLRRGEERGLWLCVQADPAAELCYRDGHIECRWERELHAFRKTSVRLSICAGFTPQEAQEGAQRVLLEARDEHADLVTAMAQRLGLTAQGVRASMELLGILERSVTLGGCAQRELWAYGIPGDAPLVSAGNEEELLQCCLLLGCGVSLEAVVYGKNGEYRAEEEQKLRALLAKAGLEALLGSGIYSVPSEAEEMLRARDVRANEHLPLRFPTLSRERSRGTRTPWQMEKGSVRFTVENSLPPRAWQNVLTNGELGYIASDCGSGFLWYANAREARWNAPPEHIEAVSGSEVLYLTENGKHISLFAANDGYECTVEFSGHRARWEKRIGERFVTVTAFLAMHRNVRIFLITGAKDCELSWGLRAEKTAALTEKLEGEIYTAQNADFPFPESFCAAVNAPLTHTALSGGFLLHFTGEERSILVCGFVPKEEIEELLSLEAVRREYLCLARETKEWEEISLPELPEEYRELVRYWLPRQIRAGRLLGRTSLYQSGGAFGFRDQLQDAVNLLSNDPSFARERILDACAHQYEEGDVMHWWHALSAGDKGVRTRCSDDLLWLVWALTETVERTGELALCMEKRPFLRSEELKETEHDRYETAVFSGEGTVLEHARRALDCCIRRGFGEHGLPFFGAHDWNDALDAVEGESVWLGWFLCDCALRFSRLLRRLGKPEAERYEELSRTVKESCEKSFNGRFYPRGYLADGSVLGGEERIDSLSQSWAALCGAKDAKTAVETALRRLVDRERSLVLLLEPPYEENPYVGSISGYGKGVRENGGQYTHAAVWLALACLRLGMRKEGEEILRLLLPSTKDTAVYEAEPYVLCADVSSSGRGGWSWYTGAAGWYYRALLEAFGA